jgi:hypothetical protein
VTYTGAWAHDHTAEAYSGNSANTGPGSASLTWTGQASFTFTGTGVTWIALRGPQTGTARVYLDNAFVRDVDTSDATRTVRAPVFTAAGLTDATHTLRIEGTGGMIVVDAFDVTLPAAVPTITRFQEADPSISYTQGWTQGTRWKFSSGELSASSTTQGALATFTFTGTSVRFIGQRSINTGIARVYLDGVLVATVDTVATLFEEFQATVFSASGLTNTTHTLAIEVTGSRNPESTGNSIVVDAFDVGR